MTAHIAEIEKCFKYLIPYYSNSLLRKIFGELVGGAHIGSHGNGELDFGVIEECR